MDQPAEVPPPAGATRREKAREKMQDRVDQLREGGELLRPVTPHEFGQPDVTEREFGNRTFLVAEVAPLDIDGVRTMAVGALLWLIAFVVMLVFRDSLADSGRDWWLWTALTGAALGLIGWVYCRRRRTYLRSLEHDRSERS
ncbi:MAG: DUF2530 domain-containing protein [Actinomycetota bacterium]|nr:DUF2530 domain-containing protein [Actinomycetota bacterium]